MTGTAKFRDGGARNDPQSRPVTTYTFGDDPSAIERMRLVAAAYEPVSRAFLAAHATPRPSVALDLGCGPGFTTALIGEVFAPQNLIGIDSSPTFLAAATARVPTARFHHHDVTVVPLPAAPAQVIYARLLLAHLPDPLGTAETWKT